MRLTFSVIWEMTRDAEIVNTRFCKAGVVCGLLSKRGVVLILSMAFARTLWWGGGVSVGRVRSLGCLGLIAGPGLAVGVNIEIGRGAACV